ncbi:vitamin K epoxide reductase family protein [Larkinella soli]|uniref:vitamin K epoxide reductase family protein n=1 Tax=Larkinella soli TaxID=1770527 RepID=UPI000FFC9CC9|nr:vitamin K epoxide reductase family protein [Larkinella soli]
MNPIQLSQELREGQTEDLNRRRWIAGLSMVGATIGQIVSLYQLGIIKHLPDPPISVFDSDKVDASAYAYKRLDTPDALMMILNYATTAMLAGAGGKDRAETNPGVPIAMGVKTLADTALNLTLAREEWQENKKLCFYCQMATVVSAATVVLAVPEVMKAVRKLFG